jgi:hypothetical protein
MDFKFRGIGIASGKMIYGYGMIKKDGEGLIVHRVGNNETHMTHVYPDSIGMYMGIEDGNGNPIYTNDKVLVDYNNTGFKTVVFKSGACNLTGHNLSRCFVKGHVHEHLIK